MFIQLLHWRNPFFWCFFGHGNDQNALGIYRCNPQPAFWHIINLEAEAIVATRKWGFHREDCHCFPNLKHPSTITVKNFEVVVYTSTWMQLLVVSWRHSHVLAITICMYPRFPSLHGWYPKTTSSIVANFWITPFWYVLTTVKALRCQQTMLRNFQHQ